MNIKEKQKEITDGITEAQREIDSLHSTFQSQTAKAQHDSNERSEKFEQEMEEKMASMNKDNMEMISQHINSRKEAEEQYQKQALRETQELEEHTNSEQSKFENIKKQLHSDLKNYALLEAFVIPPARGGHLIHDPAKRISEEGKIQSYYAQAGAGSPPINPLETFFKSADLLQKFKDTHHPDFKVHVSYDLDEIDFNYKGNSIKMYKNCIVDPPNIKPEDRDTVYNAMVDLMMTYARGNGINHHITIANPENKEIYTHMLAKRIESEGLNQTIDGKSAAEILSPKPELESQAPKLH